MRIALTGQNVIFQEDFITGGGVTRAKKGDKGTVICKYSKTDFTIVKLTDKHYPLHDVPVSIIEEFFKPQLFEGNVSPQHFLKLAEDSKKQLDLFGNKNEYNKCGESCEAF